MSFYIGMLDRKINVSIYSVNLTLLGWSFQEDLENKPLLVGDKEVDLNKIFTPAPDADEHIIKKDRKFGKYLPNLFF